jgi:phage/plasmid-associated DNA primase
MDFIFINDENDYPNEKYLIRAYGKYSGKMIGTHELIKNNCIKSKKYCLVEKKTDYYVLGWDLDFKDEIDECYLENHEKITHYIINKINEVINDISINADKNYVYAESTNGLGKHLYYIFLIVDKKLHLRIRDLVMEKIKKEKKYNYDIIDKIIDKSTCDANGIRLFGCIKDGGYYYPVKEKSTYSISGNIEEDFEYCLLNTGANKYNFNLKLGIEESNEIKVEQNIKINTIQNTKKNIINYENYKEIRELLKIIQNKNKEYKDWIKIGMLLYSLNKSSDMKEIWFEWSIDGYNWKPTQFNSPEEEINYKWDSFKEGNTIISSYAIQKIAKDNNLELYLEWYNKYYKKEIVNLIKDFDQQTVAIYFKNKKPNNYIYKMGEWYTLLNNNLWKKIYKNENSKLINDITETIKEDLTELKNNLKTDDELLKQIPSVSKRLGTSKFILGVIDFLREKYCNDYIEFDNKSNLFGFNNIVYDLKNNEFRNYEKDDYITITTGYDWIDPDKKEIELLEKIINQIHIDKNIRNFYLDIICSGLWGTTLQNIVIFNGVGSNGKSMFDDLILKAFGNYGHIINSIILCEQRKQGASTEIFNMCKKRFVIGREPPNKPDIKLSNSILKELTGSNKISARKIYSDNEETHLCLTLILECNKKPLLDEEPTEGDARRIIDLLFESKFVNKNSNDINNINIFEKNLYYIEEEFRDKHRCALIKILFEHNKNHYKNNFEIPEKVRIRSLEYMEKSFEIFAWFNGIFEKVENYTEKDYVSIQDMNDILKTSEYYQNLSKQSKRSLTREKIIDLFKESPLYKGNFVDEVNTHKDGVKVYLPKRLIGYKLKENL